MATKSTPVPGIIGPGPQGGGPNIQVVRHGRLTWVNLERPTKDEIEWLRQNYSFHPLHLDDCLSKIQRPKIDEEKDYLFVVLHFPVFNRVAGVTVASEVDAFIGADYFITVHSGDIKPLRRMFQECHNNPAYRQELMCRSSGYLLYKVIDRLVDYCFPILNKIDANIEAVEDTIFEENVRQTVRDISVIRRDIINFRRIVKPQIAVIASLEHKERPYLQEDLEAYFGDIADHVAKIWDILEDYKEVIEGLSDTNDSLTSYRINEVMKILTTISVIMLPLTLVSGIYGMNIGLPLQEHSMAFLVVMGIMLAIATGMLSYFRKRGWI
ncbi:MAG TPA: magnesium/cobalt transporter CorA [Chloroflexota bacterium]|nr:magnesium/cobalt transporter CorA [Chloroflexota bacterium]